LLGFGLTGLSAKVIKVGPQAENQHFCQFQSPFYQWQMKNLNTIIAALEIGVYELSAPQL